MATINPKDFLTPDEAYKIIGCSRRAFYRAVKRVGADAVTVRMFGRRLFRRDKLPLIKEHYFPFGSERRHELAVAAGHAGGTAKAKNLARAASSGKSDAPAADSGGRRSRRAPSQ
jgi:hypothetical protein